ncbi:unnamed protein product [Ectocarpus sp. 13 AM-2016]
MDGRQGDPAFTIRLPRAGTYSSGNTPQQSSPDECARAAWHTTMPRVSLTGSSISSRLRGSPGRITRKPNRRRRFSVPSPISSCKNATRSQRNSDVSQVASSRVYIASNPGGRRERKGGDGSFWNQF